MLTHPVMKSLRMLWDFDLAALTELGEVDRPSGISRQWVCGSTCETEPATICMQSRRRSPIGYVRRDFQRCEVFRSNTT